MKKCDMGGCGVACVVVRSAKKGRRKWQNAASPYLSIARPMALLNYFVGSTWTMM